MSSSPEATRIFKALRRIVRAIDLRSREVARRSGLTIPQIVVLQAIQDLGEVTSKALSERADLSPATVVTILDRLEERGLIGRYRSDLDRRIVHARLSQEGKALLDRAPPLLTEEFEEAFARAEPAHQHRLAEAVEEVARLMNASRIDAAAILTTGDMVEPPRSGNG